MGVTTPVPTYTRPAASWAQRALRPLALASLVVNLLIVVTGGVVRLTGSGLGCPTWPRCTEGSFTPHGAMGIHAAIEFGNRMVTFLIAAIAVATFVVAWKVGRRGLTRLALVLALGVPAQAVIGGITVLTDLNPWIVAFHLLVSMAMIAVAVTLLHRLDQPDGPSEPTMARPLVRLVQGTFVTGWVVLYLGTVVTGSGPHAGDASAPRNGLDPRAVSQLHTDVVFLLVGLSVGHGAGPARERGSGPGSARLGRAAGGAAGPGHRRLRAVLHRAAGAPGHPAPAGRGADLGRPGLAAARCLTADRGPP